MRAGQDGPGRRIGAPVCKSDGPHAAKGTKEEGGEEKEGRTRGRVKGMNKRGGGDS